jgi:hypothetical protein
MESLEFPAVCVMPSAPYHPLADPGAQMVNLGQIIGLNCQLKKEKQGLLYAVFVSSAYVLMCLPFSIF